MIDLRSDTVTQPSEEMRDAAREAEVGDDKRDGDPTVGKLESLVADRLGMESAVYVPSGTMANQIAIRALTDAGQEVIFDRLVHVYTSEYAAFAQFSQLQARTIDAAPDGCPTSADILEAVNERSQWPGSGLLVLENTHNKRGGVAVSPERIDDAAVQAQELGLRVHLDGARLGNAAVALDQPLEAFTEHADTVMFDLSKGLGAPIGAVLTGSAEIIDETRHQRNAFGGGWRQAGMMAAAGIESLQNLERLNEDHENADRLAARLDDETDLRVERPDTNLVLVDTEPTNLSGNAFLQLCEDNDVLAGSISETVIRFCLHLDVSRSDVDAAADRISDAMA